MQDIQYQDIVLAHVRLLGQRGQRQEKLKVRELVKLQYQV
jgi:hypothetical protein